MTILQAIILGIIQGLTEFLPISSSGHLVILPYLLDWQIPAEQIFPFDVLVQLGTLLAVILYFRKDIADIFKAWAGDIKAKKMGSSDESRIGWYLLLATIPAGAAGLLLKDIVEQAFGNPTGAASFLFGTALLLVLAERFGKRSRSLESMRWFDALWIGLFQVLSLFPGLSRSGACMAGAMTRNFERKSAGHFSFLMAIPVMLAAGLLSLLDLMEVPHLGEFLPVMAIGFIVSALVGYVSIAWLMNFVQNHSLVIFAIYCVLLGAAVLGFGFAFPQGNAGITSDTAQEVVLPESIVYTPELNWLAPAAADCMDATLDSSLPLQQSITSYQPAELRFAFPDPTVSAASTYQMDEQSLHFSLNAANPLQSLDAADLQLLLSGAQRTWQEFFQNCESCAFSSAGSAAFDGEIKLYIYPENSPYTRSVLEAFNLPLGGMQNALIIPNAESLLTTLQLEPAAAGFLPEQWLTPATPTVTITGLTPDALSLPVLALLDQEPAGQLKDFLLCVQDSLQ
ncbi:MAG TPA: undecaprenyl-diphosphatase UppP [Anaerolineaceae bacterium]|uniref:Undecaprenyl-diphosphatase n=1 Tax=Anaerolinea thermophila TaxID=167964 RepID=A0A101FYX8_9CHLR|nr:MAG: Undecaprenyl-diphosphatase [Anaerolinea thermophila]HAF62796.1 undecaprenyl-diphosphatase UppP [Anaerolineaceae bacterium]